MAAHRRRAVGRPGRRLALRVLLLAGFGAAFAAGARPALADDRAVLIKYRSSGPHALTECADRLSSRGESFRPHLADRSASVDQLRRRFRLGRERAVFRRPSRDPLAVQRADLVRRLEARRGRTARGQRSLAAEAPLPDLSAIYRVEVPAGVSSDALLDALRADPHVAWAQPDHVLVLDQAVPFDDPYLSSSGSWGQPYADLWGVYFIRAPEIWPSAQGEGAVAAVVDTGVDQAHPDIAANLWVNPGEDLDGNGVADPADRNGVDDDGNGFIDDLTGFDFANSVDANEDGDYDDPGDVSDADPQDDNGHGTHVAGTIAAVANNGLGIVGVAPAARVMALKGFSAEGSSSDARLWRAVLYAAENGATVVNNSWSCSTPCPVNPLAEEVVDLVDALGMVVVTSAGNRGSDVAFLSPENSARVVTVGAVGVDGLLPAFSNRGWLVDLVAPGGGPDEPSSVQNARRNILSLRAAGTFEGEGPFVVGEDYLRLSGTSMSSPHVAGAVAILRSLRPELTPEDVRLLFRLGSRDLGDPGDDPQYGAGSLDLVDLLDAPLPDVRLEIASPRVGTNHDPARGPVVVRGFAEGADLASIEVAVARGLSGRAFVPLDSFGDSSVEPSAGTAPRGAASEPSTLARWDVADVPDGPNVLRLRGRLDDGRVVDAFTIIGIERNPPTRLSSGTRKATAPDLSGQELVWQTVDESEFPILSDLVLGVFPDPRKPAPAPPRPLDRPLDLPGEQWNPARDGPELVWSETSEEGQRFLKRCRLVLNKLCRPLPVSGASGDFGAPYLRDDWIVWSRNDAGRIYIEGCPVGVARPACVPRALVDPASGGDWVLHSFDGVTLLVSRPGRLARCRIEVSGTPCVPEDVTLAPGFTALEPKHDGDLLAFSRIDVAFVPPPGCGVGDPRPGCAPELEVLVEFLACELTPRTSFCDPILVSDKQPVERTQGLAVSGRRVVWAMGSATEEPAIRFCELDGARRTCPVQRIGGALAAETEPVIDANRVVWLDARDGEVAVFGLALPDLQAPAAAKAKAGLPFSIGLVADPGASRTLRYEIEAIAGLDPVAAGARIADAGAPGGAISLIGRMPPGSSGTARWRVRAIGGGGLASERVIELSIFAWPPGPTPPPTPGGIVEPPIASEPLP